MNKPIPDKAEVAIEYPDKLYIGTFERSSRFDAHFDEHGISSRDPTPIVILETPAALEETVPGNEAARLRQRA